MKTFYARLSRSESARRLSEEAGGREVDAAEVDATIKQVIDSLRRIAEMRSGFPKASFEKLEDENGTVFFENVSVGMAGSATTPSGDFAIFTTAGFNVVLQVVA